MKKRQIMALILIGLAIFGVVAVSGCTTGREVEHGVLTSKKTTTSIGWGGVEKETKTCPFWDRDC